MDNMCISSLVVRTRPEHLGSVRRKLEKIPQAELYGHSEDGRLVVVLDCDSSRQAADTITEIQQQPEILSATLIYQFDDQFGTSKENPA